MRINVYAVGPLIHYTPLLTALNSIRELEHIDVKFYSSGSDSNVIKSVLESPVKEGTIDLFITSVSDLEFRLKELLPRADQIKDIYQNYIIWRTLIDRIPISIVRNHQGNTRDAFACYPKGSTIHWFVNTKLANLKLERSELIEVEFGEDREFNLLKNNDVKCAITLEPWRLQGEYKDRNWEYSPPPIQPFGFTALGAHVSTVTNERKRQVIRQLIKCISAEIKAIYSLFELGELSDASEEAHKEHYFARTQKSFERLWNKCYNTYQIKPALRWMAENRIWDTDAINPLTESSNLKTAYQKIDELSSQTILKQFSLVSIHQLKNELREKIVRPLERVVRTAGNAQIAHDVTEVIAYASRTASHHENLLDALSENVSNMTIRDVAELVDRIRTTEKKEFIRFASKVDEMLNIEMRGSVLYFMLNGIIENALERYRPQVNDVQEILVTVNDVPTIAGQRYVELSVYNSGSWVESEKLAKLGLFSLESDSTHSGRFLRYLNEMLKSSNAYLIEENRGRYFLPENIPDPKGFKVSMLLCIL